MRQTAHDDLRVSACWQGARIWMIVTMAKYYLYILSSRHHRYLTVGMTADLAGGVASHQMRINRRLRRKRVLQKLVYVESIGCVDAAVERELLLRKAPRRELVQLIESVNPGWDSISVSELVNAGFSDRR